MHKTFIFIVFLFFIACKGQSDYNSDIQFTSNLTEFKNLANLKEALKDVEIIALGENTHGLGEVFTVKTDLVKYLHEELGFTMVLFESGFGDAALAWEQIDSLSAELYTTTFTSNFYYKSKEIEGLMQYVKNQNKDLVIQGFDCQPQQKYLIQRMTEIIQPVDSVLANSVSSEMQKFYQLYQFENDKDTVKFYNQRNQFISFLLKYDEVLLTNKSKIIKAGTSNKEVEAIEKAHQIFIETYANIELGGMMSWPASANIRDKALLETVKWFKSTNPKAKIIIWAQNSHIENAPKPNYNVNWMGHGLKEIYGDKYYALGTIVYSGKNLNYNGSFDFEHNNKDYLAYHLNLFDKEKFLLDLRNHHKKDFTTQLLTGMESGGATAEFVAKDRFDGILFLKYSDIPTLIGK